MKLLSLGTRNPYRVINYFYLLTYFLTTLTALFAVRRFGVAPLPGVVAALLYAFLPYHFYRGVNHLLLSGYYMIPLIAIVILWLYLGKWAAERDDSRIRQDILAAMGRALRSVCSSLEPGPITLSSVASSSLRPLLLCPSGPALDTPGPRRAARVNDRSRLLLNLLPCFLYQRAEGIDPDVALGSNGSRKCSG